MSRYYLRLNGHPHADTEDLSEAITLADTVLQNGQPTTPMTLTIETADGYLLGALSTRRIRGRFHKQQWEGANTTTPSPAERSSSMPLTRSS